MSQFEYNLTNTELLQDVNTLQYQYKVTVNSRTNLLKDVNIKSGLLHILRQLQTIHTTHNCYYQMEISFSELKKKYLKSGIFNLHKTSGSDGWRNGPLMLEALLQQVITSSENLFLDNSFQCNIFVMKTDHVRGFRHCGKQQYRSKMCKDHVRKATAMFPGLGPLFLNQLANGIFDLALFYNLNNDNCILYTFYAAFLLLTFDRNILRIISLLFELKSISNVEHYIWSHLHMPKETFEEEKLILIIKRWTTILKNDILLFTLDSERNEFELSYSTNFFSQRQPIKLALNGSHLSVIYQNYNLSKKTIFCDFCRRNVQYGIFRYHKCKNRKCVVCFEYLSDCVQDPQSTEHCSKCFKVFRNMKCKDIHMKLSKTNCQRYLKCSLCKQIHSKVPKHECGKTFCSRCLSLHEKASLCPLFKKNSPNSDKKKIIYFLYIEKNTKSLVCSWMRYDTEELKIYNKTSIETFKYTDKDFEKLSSIHFGEHKLNEDFLNKIFQPNSKSDDVLIYVISDFDDICNMKFKKPKYFTFKNSITRIKTQHYVLARSDKVVPFQPIYLLYLMSTYLSINPILMCNKIMDYSDIETLTHDKIMDSFNNSNLDFINWFSRRITQLMPDFKSKYTNEMSFFIERGLSIVYIFNMSYKQTKDFFLRHFAQYRNQIENSNSITSMGFSILQSSCDHIGIPVLSPSMYTLKNTSRQEICCVGEIGNYHLEQYPKHKIFCITHNNGVQWKMGRLSLDFYCFDCKIGIQVTGLFKYICPKHNIKIKNADIFQSQHKMHQNTEFKRKLILEGAPDVDLIYTIATCCINRNEFPHEFENDRRFFYPGLGENIQKRMMEFKQEQYMKINVQDCIRSSLTLYLKQNVSLDSKSDWTMTKLDVNFAYIQSIYSNEYCLPTGQEDFYVGQAAKEMFPKLLESNKFAFVKLKIIYPENILPFIPFRMKNKLMYSVCHKCCLQIGNANGPILKCNYGHLDSEKSFIFSMYLVDIRFMLKNIPGFTINDIEILQLQVFNADPCIKLKGLCQDIFKLKKDVTDKFSKAILKSTVLQGLGRFSLNLIESGQNTTVFKSKDKLRLFLESKKILSVSRLDNCLLGIMRTKFNNFDLYSKSAKAGVCSPFFGMANSILRQEMYKIYLDMRINPNRELIRIDTDSVLILHKKSDNLTDIFQRQFSYKIELDKILSCKSFSIQSHLLESDNFKLLKTCGLSLSLSERMNL